MTDPAILDKVIKMLISGISEEATRHTCVENLGLNHAQAAEAVVEARQRITIAADYNRDQELGTAIARLRDLYTRSISVQDVKTALAAQKELNRLLKLYDVPHESPTEDTDLAELRSDYEAAREHLTPLELADHDAPLAEHARLAVATILDLQGRTDGTE